MGRVFIAATMVGETGTEVLPKPYVSDCVERPVVSSWRQRQQQVVRIQVEQEAARFKAGQGGDYGCRQVERIVQPSLSPGSPLRPGNTGGRRKNFRMLMTNEKSVLRFCSKKSENKEFLMTLAMLAVLSALLIVSGLIYILRQLMNAWCDPEHPQAGNSLPGTADDLLKR